MLSAVTFRKPELDFGVERVQPVVGLCKHVIGCSPLRRCRDGISALHDIAKPNFLQIGIKNGFGIHIISKAFRADVATKSVFGIERSTNNGRRISLHIRASF